MGLRLAALADAFTRVEHVVPGQEGAGRCRFPLSPRLRFLRVGSEETPRER
jgi:hypothetical protein